VLAHDLHVDLRAEHVMHRRQQFRPDRHREQAGGAEVDEHADQVLNAHHLVVERVPEVAGQAGCLVLGQGARHHRRAAGYLPQEIAEDSEPGQPADDRQHVSEHDRPVAGV
jgi:hypothetical protein